jgi:threonine/homoserine/homoserine lactone efflux protein
MSTALGVFTADLVWMTASVIGLTAVLVAFEPAFLAVRPIGSAYLIVLGLRLLFSRDHGPSEDRSSPQRVDSRRLRRTPGQGTRALATRKRRSRPLREGRAVRHARS